MKILIISGFLGAGKTTFIKTLIQRTKRDFVVLENEYGGTNLDTADLRTNGNNCNIWELTEGCVCCSTKQSFASSVLTIANSLDPEYLIVEPTGAAMLGNLISNLRQIQYENIVLLKPVTILDSRVFSNRGGDFSEIWSNQLKFASTLIFSKTESLEENELSALTDAAQIENSDAEIITQHYSRLPNEWFLGLLDRYLDAEYCPNEQLAQDVPDTLTLRQIQLPTSDALIVFLNGLTSGVFGNIVRSKGCLPAGQAWLRFDTVEHIWSIAGVEAENESSAVFIGKNLRRDWLRMVLNSFCPPKVPIRKNGATNVK